MTLILLLAAVLVIGLLLGVLARMPFRHILIMLAGMAAVALVFYGLTELVA